jgi:hypothetical protein
MILSGAAVAARTGAAQAPGTNSLPADTGEDTPDKFLLKDYRPVSIYRIPKSDIKKAKYPIIDVHNHGFRPPQEIDQVVKLMDAVGVEKSVIFTAATTAERFREACQPYAKYPKRFDMWCGFDLTGVDQSGFGPGAVKALEECHRLGALGIGEVSDKGWGFRVSSGGSFRGQGGQPSGAGGRSTAGAIGAARGTRPAILGPHPDDARMDALWDKCAQLGMPINIHVSDPYWSYLPQDKTNDGYMNGYSWRIDEKQPGILGHNGLIESLERTAKKHPKTIFIACHLMNLDYDLTRLGQIFDRNPNLFVDISARFAETAPIPRFVNQFLQKYPDRVCYGTDMAYTQRMFSTTFRILESQDEHFYERDLNFNFDYHWPLNGFGLPDALLKKVYSDNARRAFQRARNSAA